MSSKTSIFAAYIHRTYGAKHLVLALLETGITWAPSQSLMRWDFKAAQASVARGVVRWFRNLNDAIAVHKNDPTTAAARQRSGCHRNVSGLTESQTQERWERSEARRQMAEAQYLQACYDLASGYPSASRRKGWGKGSKGKGVREVVPLRWYEMTSEQQNLLWRKWEGYLDWDLQRTATAHGGRVQANPFTATVPAAGVGGDCTDE